MAELKLLTPDAESLVVARTIQDFRLPNLGFYQKAHERLVGRYMSVGFEMGHAASKASRILRWFDDVVAVNVKLGQSMNEAMRNAEIWLEGIECRIQSSFQPIQIPR